MKITFEQLLSQVGEVNIEELQSKRERLEKKRAELQARLAEVQKELKEVEYQVSAPVRQAIKAAKILGVEVPSEYQHNGANGKSNGRFEWEVKGQVPFMAEISRAMWRLSKGSGGSAGQNGEGVLTAEEFWSLAGVNPEAV